MKRYRDVVEGGGFSISAELTLQQQSTPGDIARQVDALGGLADGILVTDNPWSWTQMSAVAAAGLVLKAGADPVTVLNCRDRNRIALKSDLVGLRAMGATSVLLSRGHKIPKEHETAAKAVFDTSSSELIAIANELNEDQSVAEADKFFIGTAARAFRPGAQWRAQSLKLRAKSGARFLQTQLCFDTRVIRKYLEAMVREKLTWKYAVVVSLAVLPSVEVAIWLMKNLQGAKIPVELVQRLESAADPVSEGIDMCAELIREISGIPGISGVNLMTVGDPQSIVAAIRASGLRT